MSTDPPVDSNPDFGNEFSGKPTGWATMSNTIRNFDKEKVKECNDDIDALLVFAGLYSAVLSAFLVAVYPLLQPDREDLILYALDRIASQTASYNLVGSNLTASNVPPASPPQFHAEDSIVKVNTLWFISLIISLSTASLGLLVKQWLREFLAMDVPSPQGRLRLRRIRAPSIEAWKVYDIAPALPVLLQIALGLFFLGLCYLAEHLHSGLRNAILPFIAGWAFCIVATISLPFVFPRCPYKITVLKPIVLHVRRGMFSILEQGWRLQTFVPLAWSWRGRGIRWLKTLWVIIQQFPTGLQPMYDEATFISDTTKDLDIFLTVDAIDANDELLITTITEAVNIADPQWKDVVFFIVQVLLHRIPESEARAPATITEFAVSWPFRNPYRFTLMRSRTRNGILDILSRSVEQIQEAYDTIDVDSVSADSVGILCATYLVVLAAGIPSEQFYIPHGTLMFLQFYIKNSSYGPKIREDLVKMICSPRSWTTDDDRQDSWEGLAHLLLSLAKLIPLLKLDLIAAQDWFETVQTTVAIDLLKMKKLPKPRMRDAEDSGVPWQAQPLDWKTWKFPPDDESRQDDEGVPPKFRHTTIQYLICLASLEFSLANNPENHLPDRPEGSQILRIALQTITDGIDGHRPALKPYRGIALVEQEVWLGFQDMVDAALQSSSSALALVQTLLQGAGERYWPILFKKQLVQKRGLFPLPQDSDAVSQHARTAIKEKLLQCNEEDGILKLCHVASCLIASVGYKPGSRGNWKEIFNTLAGPLIASTVSGHRPDLPSTHAEQRNVRTRDLARGCLVNVDFALSSTPNELLSEELLEWLYKLASTGTATPSESYELKDIHLRLSNVPGSEGAVQSVE